MMRTFVVVVLSLATICTAAVGWTGFFRPLYCGYSITDRLHCYVLFADGFVRFSCSRADEPIYLEPYSTNRWIAVRRSANDALCLRIHHINLTRLDPWEFISRTFGPAAGSTAPVVQVKAIRMWMGLPMIFLIAYPVIVLGGVRIRRHRHKPGHCLNCEYNLTGNTSGVCPECGTSIEPP